MESKFSKLTYAVALSIYLTVSGHASASPRIPLKITCAAFFEGERVHAIQTIEAIAVARKRLTFAEPKRDREFDFEGNDLRRHLDALKLSDAEFADLVKPNSKRDDSIEAYVARGMTFEEAVIATEYGKHHPELVEYFDQAGRVRLDLLPTVSLSLENGRQKLDFARIHYTVREELESSRVLVDYLSAATTMNSLRLLVVTDQPRAKLDAFLSKAPEDVRKRVEILEVGKEAELSMWAQDGSKPLEGASRSIELGSTRYKPGNEALSAAGRIAFEKQLPFLLQGGNIIVGDRHVFVGQAEIHSTLMAFKVSQQRAVEILSHVFGKPVLPLWVKSSIAARPWSFHIDLDMVLAVDRKTNREVALVRSPEALLNDLSGMKLTAEPTIEEIKAIRTKVVDRYEAGIFGKSLDSGSRRFLETFATWSGFAIQQAIASSRMMKRTLRSYGYEVRDLPGFGDTTMNKQLFFFGTNAILTDRHAIIPSNQMPELDRRIAAIYRDMGYDVVPMRSSSATICKQGGIRCATETYRRPRFTQAP
ncbi:MAG: hypothetical protein V4760_09985 [Bdellovibrionota bacterium]